LAYDFKKEDKALYNPKTEPSLVTVPPMLFLAVEGKGDPNEPDGAYSAAVQILYTLSYTVKMSQRSGTALPGFYPYRVGPLEGLWWMADGRPGVDSSNKAAFCWTALIRQPEFVDDAVLVWARGEALRKKRLDTSAAYRLEWAEGLCVQCMHIGSYDDEPATVERMHRFLDENGYRPDLSEARRHHEIYLGDPRRSAPEKLRTVLRQPIAPKG